MVHVAELVAYPCKSMDGVHVDRAELGPKGAVVGDRTYAVVEEGVDPHEASVGGGGGYVNGKSERRVHELSATYELAGDGDATPIAIALARPDGEQRRFELPAETDAMAAWLGDFFGYEVDVVRVATGLPDDRNAHGPTVISRATLEEVASWFDGIDATGMRRRLRPNVVLDDCPAFWEDRLFADRDHRVRFRVGGAELAGNNPCQRCVVPSRDPDTGEEYPGFRETFVEKRRETMPEWSGGDWFDHHFRLMVNTHVPEGTWGTEIAVGDGIEVLETVPAE